MVDLMHVIEPARFSTPKPKKSHRLTILLAVIGLILAGAIINFCRPVPQPTASLSVHLPKDMADPSFSWPAQGQASAAAEGYGLLGTSGTMTPLATASIAKVITALCVLEKKPLMPGQSGPTYTIGSADMALYQTYADENGSLLPVTEGEKLTEYQALEALMIPSANNIADSLVRWVFGSQSAYKAYATQFLQTHGLTQTQIGPDASGFDPGTVSTASDLATLGELALKNPVLLEIAGKSSTTLPGIGVVYNYDTVLGVHGITGLKTGNNDADLGAFLFTANIDANGTTIPVTGAVMGGPDLGTALQDSTQLVASLSHDFSEVSVASGGQAVGTVHTPWGASTTIITKQALQFVRWNANPVSEKHQLDVHVRSGTIGKLQIFAGRKQAETPLLLDKPLAGPGFWWRLTRH